MLPFMIPMLLGAGAGALLNRKDPLKGALMGAAGSAIAPGLGSMFGGAAGAATPGIAGVAGEGVAGAGGLLSSPLEHLGAASNLGTSVGSQQTAQLAAQQAGMGGGLLGNVGPMIDKVSTFAKPVMQGVQAAQQMMPPEQQLQMPAPPPSVPQGPPNLTGLLELGEQRRTYNDQMAEMRRQKQQAAVNRMMG